MQLSTKNSTFMGASQAVKLRSWKTVLKLTMIQVGVYSKDEITADSRNFSLLFSSILCQHKTIHCSTKYILQNWSLKYNAGPFSGMLFWKKGGQDCKLTHFKQNVLISTKST